MKTCKLRKLAAVALVVVGLLTSSVSAALIPQPATSFAGISFSVDDYADGVGVNPRNVNGVGASPFLPFPSALALHPVVDNPGSQTTAAAGLTWGAVGSQEFILLTSPTYLIQPATARAEATLLITFLVEYLVGPGGNEQHDTMFFLSLVVNVLDKNDPADPDPFASIRAVAAYTDTQGVIPANTGVDLQREIKLGDGPFPTQITLGGIPNGVVHVPALPAGDVMRIVGLIEFKGDPASIEVDFSFGPQGFGPIPEPSSLALASLGLLGVVWARRRSLHAAALAQADG